MNATTFMVMSVEGSASDEAHPTERVSSDGGHQ